MQRTSLVHCCHWGLLKRSHKTDEYWQSVAKNIKEILNSSEYGQCLDVLYLSYSHLPAHPKPYFLYTGTFKEDSRICVSKIIKLWVAEGFLKPNGVQILEEMAEDYLKDLIDRNLILVCAHRSNGRIKSFRIHDLLRELCLKTSSYFNNEVFKAFQSASLARSLICNVAEAPVKCRLLRVLNKALNWSLEAGFQNVNLRYVDCQLSKLLPSISLIWNLQTLVIVGANHLIVAPLEIWKMAQLRHLSFDRVLLPDPPPCDDKDDSVVLRNLQTLKVVMDFRLSEEACKRIPNIKKINMRYGYIWQGDDLQNLGRLQRLESINVCCFYQISISELKNKFPSSIKKLIGSLPQLEVLKLRSRHSHQVQKWSCVEGGDLGEIPTLQLIRLENCKESLVISAMKIKEEQESFGYYGLQIQVKIFSAYKKGLIERANIEGLSIKNIHLEFFD